MTQTGTIDQPSPFDGCARSWIERFEPLSVRQLREDNMSHAWSQMRKLLLWNTRITPIIIKAVYDLGKCKQVGSVQSSVFMLVAHRMCSYSSTVGLTLTTLFQGIT